MAAILAYVTSIFNFLFVSMDSTANPAAPSAIASVIDLIVGTPYLMIGLALMVAGAAIGFLSRLIRNT